MASDVIFEEEDAITRKIVPKAKKPSLISRMVMATGMAHTMAEAEQVLLIVAIVALVLAVGIVLIGNQPPHTASESQIQAQLDHLKAEDTTPGS